MPASVFLREAFRAGSRQFHITQAPHRAGRSMTFAMRAAIVVGLVTLAAGCGSNSDSVRSNTAASGTTGASSGSTGSSGLSGTSAASGSDTGHNPWISYVTDVNPGSGVQFATNNVGWELDGQGAAPHLDDSLAAGPNGTNLDWPGTSVSKTTDGGKSWTTIDSPANGVWGFDLLTPSVGWVVGVTGLYVTTDGGSSWTADGEPSSGHLVAVTFFSTKDGFGLSTSGGLVSSTDGGLSWQATSLSSPISALCFPTAAIGYASAENGDIYQTTDSGHNWTDVNKSPIAIGSQTEQLWSSLACSQSEVAQGLEALIAMGAGYTPYSVTESTNGGSSWNAVAADANGAPNVSIPSAPAPVSTLAGVVAAQGTIDIIGSPASHSPLAVDLVPVVSSSTGQTVLNVPVLVGPSTLAAGGSAAQIQVHGVSFVGSDGWILYDDDTFGQGSSFGAKMVLAHTADGGSSWVTLGAGSTHTY